MKVVLVSSPSGALVRVGVERLLGSQSYTVLDRERPGSVYSTRLSSAPRLLGTAHRALGLSTAFSDADLVVNCGGSVMFHGVAAAPWQRPVWDDALGRRNRPTVLSLSGGSRFPWTERRPTQLSVGDESALRRMFRRTDLFTASDREAGRLAEFLGMPAPVLPSVAMHAGGGDHATGDSSTLLLNLAPGAGELFDDVIARRARTDRILLLCHTPSELDHANERWPEHQAVLPTSTEEYLQVMRRCRVGLVQNPQAAVVLAGLGIPCLAVGVDTRLLMVQECGQETAHLPSLTPRGVLALLDMLDTEFEPRRKTLLNLEERAFRDHQDAVHHALKV